MKIFKKIFKFFDKTEDKTRAKLSRHPIIYATLGGVGLAIFWKGIWQVIDSLSFWNGQPFDKIFFFEGIILLAVSFLLLTITGLFVSFFIGDRIILSGLKQEKKLEEKTEEELEAESNVINEMKAKVDKIEENLEKIKESLSGGSCRPEPGNKTEPNKNTDIYN